MTKRDTGVVASGIRPRMDASILDVAGTPPPLVVAAIGAAILALLIMFVTHDPVADGPKRQYVLAVAQLFIGSCVFVITIHRQWKVSRTTASVAFLTLILAGSGIHLTRTLHPLARGVPDQLLDWHGAAPGRTLPSAIELVVSAPASLEVDDDAYVLSVRGGGNAAIQFEQKPVPIEWPWWAPIGANSLARAHRITWDAVASRTAPYLVVLNSGRLRIQLTASGIMVTAPDGRGDVSQETLPVPIVAPGTRHRWEVLTSPDSASLAIDAAVIWSMPRSAELGTTITLGDAMRDREHGGELRLTSMRYERWPVPGGSR